ncbi:MAG: YigZ family protein [Ignavibacteria bacterium]|jgi:uncharacterized YigZ family protein
MTDEEIKTVINFNEFKFKEKGSLFIGQSFKIDRESDFSEIKTRIKKEYYDATHHCFAYKLLDGTFKYSDDGEPNGTAGIRIYNAIQHFELTKTLVFVIRYYGGTKLGVGPLGKAYYYAAEEVLKNAEIKKLIKHIKIEIRYDFEYSSTIHYCLNKYNAKILESNFEQIPSITSMIKPLYFSDLEKNLIEKSSNNVKIIQLGEEFI